MSEIRDISQAESGRVKIEWAGRHMPVLRSIKEEFEKEKPFQGLKVALSIHLEAKTAFLCKTLAAAGAEMYITGSNPLSTQDDIAAALAAEGLNVFAWHAATPEEYQNHLRRTVENGPDVVIDDGGDLVNILHQEYPQLCEKVIGGCEETTTGVIRLQAMDKEGVLRFPMMLVNDAQCKHFFDNRYGTGQSVWDSLNHVTNLCAAGKQVVVSGYGWCGKGVAMRAKGLGARVIVTEVDPVKAIEAIMDGFDVMSMAAAAPLGDVFVTVTGCRDVITEQDFLKMKDGAILSNAGHFNVEIDVARLAEMATETKQQRPSVQGFKMPNGNWLSLIGEGRLVNLAAGNGHPAEIMDMSFAVQAKCAEYMVKNRPAQKINKVPPEIDFEVASRKLRFEGYSIDTLTAAQKKYLDSWKAE